MSDVDGRLDPFDYCLPKEAIARFPPKDRDGGRLLASTPSGWMDGSVRDLVEHFSEGDVLVVNNTRVLSARMFAQRVTGGRVELLLLNSGPGPLEAMVRPSRKIRVGERLNILNRVGDSSSFSATVGEPTSGGGRWVQLSAPAMAIMNDCGTVPLPPYLERPASEDDERRYQTVFATVPGAVAAPTASLHLTPKIMDAFIDKGVAIHSITLHVGAGTFRNLRSEDLDRGTLHSEWFEIPDDTVEAIREAKRTGGRVTAVGTTVTRALESAALVDGAVRPGSGETSLFIQSGFQFRVVDRMMTNFHLPRTSLLILVCAFGGRDRVLAGYSQAVRLGYRFYSYGDAMLLNREDLDRS